MNQATCTLCFGAMLVLVGLAINSTWSKSPLNGVGDLIWIFGLIVMATSLSDRSISKE